MQILQIALIVVVFLLSYPVALLLFSLTKDEKKLYKRYFPSFLWILAILAAVFYTLNLQVALTLTFMFLVIFFWNRK